MKRLFYGLLYRFAAFRRDERGYAVMATLAIFLFLFVLCAAVYAVGETIHERIKIQNACDAAAYSAAAVQADGLSRMACVNRAMSWTYVQMSNRQMDYITYRWLKLVNKRFDQDKNNAKDYASQLVVSFDPNLGLWALLTAAVSAGLDIVFGMDCASGGHEKKNTNGLAYWTGLGSGSGKNDPDYSNNSKVRLNRFEDMMSLRGAASLFTENFPKEWLEKIVSFASVFDSGSGDEPENWGALLGALIDWDKVNIYQMNKSLARINYEMTRSMRETAENVLKASLTDNRLAPQNSLADYYVSIVIPYASNPYTRKNGVGNETVASYFSPLRNTEVDERLFLQMPATTANLVQKPLAAFFPKLLIGSTSTAFGIDQWFVRARGKYFDMDNLGGDDDWQVCRNDGQADLWMKCPAARTFDGGQSGWLKPDSDDLLVVGPRIDNARLTGTERSEGELGIQRSYKDSNINETKAGFSIVGGPVNRGNHLVDLSEVASLAMDVVGSGFKKFFGGEGDAGSGGDPAAGGDDDDDDGGVSSRDDIEKMRDDTKKEIAELEKERDALKREKNGDPPPGEERMKEIDSRLSDIDKSLAELNENLVDLEDALAADDEEDDEDDDDGTTVSGGNETVEGEAPSTAGALISGLITSILRNVGGRLTDINPSCENKTTCPQKPKQFLSRTDKEKNRAMCHRVSDTTALFAEYRWASCKYYCLTTASTWLKSVIWGFKTYGKCDGCYSLCGPYTGKKSKHKRIYCNSNRSHTFYKKKLLGIKIHISGIGRGHYGFPKWFCGGSPTCLGDKCAKSLLGSLVKKYLLSYFPPIDPQRIKGDIHGYMDSTLDVGTDGFLKPIQPLWSSKHRDFKRDEYCSCAMFPDGTFRWGKGSDSAAGIIRGHARIYGDDKEIFDNRYVGAKCMPWILNEKFFNGEGTIVVGAAKKFYNPFSQLIGFLGNEKAIADYDKSVLSAFKIPKNNYMWTMSAARAGVRRRRRNCGFDKERMYQVTYDPTPDAVTLHYHDDKPVLLQYNQQENKWEGGPTDLGKKENELKERYEPLVWDGCVCRTENKERFRDIWNLCESDWDATLLPLRYARVGASLYLPSVSGRDRRAFVDQAIRDRRHMVDFAYNSNVDSIGAGTNWVWTATGTVLDPQRCEKNPFTDSWWKRATDDYFDVLNFGTHSIFFLPEANTLPDKGGKLTDDHYWNMFQQNRIL